MAVLAFIVFVFFPAIGYAYLDPGSASLMVQGIIAAIASVLTAITVFRKRIVSFVKRKRPEEPEKQE